MAKKRRRSRQSLKERSVKTQTQAPRRIHKTAGKISVPVKSIINFSRREYFLPMPDNNLGRFLNKRRKLTPTYFREAWRELRLVTWPGRRETWKLTLAVFVFATAFGIVIAITDYGLDKVFKRIILN